MAKWLIGATLLGVMVLPLLVLMVAVGAFGGVTAATASAAGMSPVAVDAYTRAAERCEGLDWFVLAGIGQVETSHGTDRGATVGPDGGVAPPIVGIPLDGTNGTAVVPDSDGGVLDGDPVWDRAVGPMQFLPTSWTRFGVDGNADGVASAHNLFDAAAAAADHLCPPDGSIGDTTELRAALFGYNRSDRVCGSGVRVGRPVRTDRSDRGRPDPVPGPRFEVR